MSLHNDIDTTGCGVSLSEFHDVFCFNNWRQPHKRMNAPEVVWQNLFVVSVLHEITCHVNHTWEELNNKMLVC